MLNNSHGSCDKLVVIGSSTGGPQALQELITRLPTGFRCPILIVQHMPAGFTGLLANRLDTLSPLVVKEAQDGEPIRYGRIYIAFGDKHLRLVEEQGVRKISLGDDPPVGRHRPAVNVMFESVAHLGRQVVAVILTGMGSDGLEGTKQIKAQGGHVIAQDEATCVVYGMPKAVVQAGLADEVCALPDIADAIVAAVERKGV